MKVYIQFTEHNLVRKWDTKPFDGAETLDLVQLVMNTSALRMMQLIQKPKDSI